jgi:hypothetical protein
LLTKCLNYIVRTYYYNRLVDGLQKKAFLAGPALAPMANKRHANMPPEQEKFMPNVDRLARSAKRAQFRVVKEVAGPAAPRLRKSKTMPGVRRPETRIVGEAGATAQHILLYRRMFADIAQLVADNNPEDRDSFFYCMKLMSLMGLRTEDVTAQLRFTPETIARWVNGSRCPHPELRQYVLDKCLGILQSKVHVDLPREFVRLGD